MNKLVTDDPQTNTEVMFSADITYLRNRPKVVLD